MMLAFIPPDFYQSIQGIMLLVALAAILVAVYMMNENRSYRFTLLHDELKRLKDAAPAPGGGRELIEPLTGREREVLQYLLSGMSNQEIGIALNISLNTVKTHVRNIYGKYDVRGRMELHRIFYQAKDV